MIRRLLRTLGEYLGVIEPPGPPEYVPGADPDDDGLQPLPPTLDALHVPETRPYVCAECGHTHEAVLERVLPLGVKPSTDLPEVQLTYRAVACPNTPAEPSTGPTPEPMLEPSPRVWRDEEDGT